LLFEIAFSYLQSFNRGGNRFAGVHCGTMRHRFAILLKTRWNTVETCIFFESHKIQSVSLSWKAVASVFCAAGVINIEFILENPTVDM
jgi:hypothetical protein